MKKARNLNDLSSNSTVTGGIDSEPILRVAGKRQASRRPMKNLNPKGIDSEPILKKKFAVKK